MNSSKAEILKKIEKKVSLFKIPYFCYFTVEEYSQHKEDILKKINSSFNSAVVVRSSSIFEDGLTKSLAGEFETVLDVNSSDKLELDKAISKVINSYHSKQSPKNQIIVQEMVKKSSMSGVIFTHELNSGAPYYVINYDDQSGSTDTVTSGKSEYSNRTLYIHRKAMGKLNSQRFLNLISAVEELERIVKSKYLDIEFALGKDLTPYLLQVRPITTIYKWNKALSKHINKALDDVFLTIKDRFSRVDGAFGKTTVFGQMPDWNPVEMIGRVPRALASSLYKKVITDHVWRSAREKMGYSVPKDTSLMLMLAGQPFIDTRLSFHSFLPKSIPPTIAEKLVDHWVKTLSKSPHLHDKIEFDVSVTSYSFDINEKIKNLIGEVLDDNEKKIFIQSHLEHTRALITGNNAGSINEALKLIKNLKQLQKNNVPKCFNSLSKMLDDCIMYGTVPFAILARHGFIAKTILYSLEKEGIFNKKDIRKFELSINTVASELIEDMGKLYSNKISTESFMKKYGHLRPGTYDIMSQRYDQMKDFIENSRNFKSNNKPKLSFKLSKNKERDINKILEKCSFVNFNAYDLLQYINDATVGREYGKFIFTKTLSDILELIGELTDIIGLNREETSHIPIDDFLHLTNYNKKNNVETYLKSISRKEEKKYEINSCIRLPHLLIDDAGVYVVPFQVSHPNFITRKKVNAEIVFLDQEKKSNLLNGKLVLIEGADPGYDWIFSHEISGLITKYGGANSHMAIRCAEFGIPAAIGCGEQIFERLLSVKKIHLDCAAEIISPLSKDL